MEMLVNDDLTAELMGELDAFNPEWRAKYVSVTEAAHAAAVQDLYYRWLLTADGTKYLGTIRGVPDHVGESRRIAQAERQQPRSLPFGYDNLGWLPDSAWDPS